MSETEKDPEREAWERSRLSRGELLKRGAAGAAAVGVLGAAGSAGAAAQSDIAQIKKLIGPIDPKTAGKGMTWRIGSVLAFSGTGAYYGREMSNGINLAVKHIAALGGPTIKVVYKDHASGDPQKGIQAALAFSSAKLPALLTSYGAVIGSMVPAIGRYHMLTLDPGGGNGPPNDSKPYFYGTRTWVPNDHLPVVLDYVKAKMPTFKTLVAMYPDFGALSDGILENTKKLAATMGYEVTATIKPKWGASDFSAEIAALRATKSDFIFNVSAQLDQAYLMKQFKVSGINRPIFGIEYVGPPAKVAGAAYNGMYFAQDDFNAAAPASPWAKIFVKEYRAAYGDDSFPQATPDFYAAGYYEATFALWDLFRRVNAKKGNVNDGAQLQAALQAKPLFASVFGGTANTVGKLGLDKVRHGPTIRPIGLYQVRNGVPVRLATSGLRGKGFQLLS